MTSLIIISASAGGFTLSTRYCGVAESSDRAGVSEYEVKAAFLLNFIRFIEWPGERERGGDGELVLCIAGEDPFGRALNLIEGKTIRGKKLLINTTHASRSLADCHLLFIPSSEKVRLPSLLKAVRGLPVLTVSETERFAESGGMINFITVNSKVRFEINPDAAQKVGIHISSRLLQLARIVRENRDCAYDEDKTP